MNYLPVIIIGAPRSGTNMLRDILTSFDGVGTWPCDEINYIWRHGNVRYPSDEIPTSHATPAIKKFIRQRFEMIAKTQNIDVVVEKTCANSLRVPFVNQIVPDAKYIFIYRDGIDAIGSAKLRWTAELDLSYILKKVRFVPIMDLPYYAVRYFWSRLHRLISRERRLAFWGERRLAFWGPALDNIQEILQRHTLNEICALQWQSCVEKSEEAFSVMPEDKVVRVCYEEFVRHPERELEKILSFLGKKVSEAEIIAAVKKVSNSSLEKGRKRLGDEQVKHLESLIGETLKRYGYL